MGRGKRIIFSTGVCLILLVSVYGCAAEQTISSSLPTATKTFPSVYKVPGATNTIHIVPNPPTWTPEYFITPSPVSFHFPTPAPTLTPEIISAKLKGYETICPTENPIDQNRLALIIEPTGQYGFNYEKWIPRLPDKQITDLLNKYGLLSFVSYIDHNVGKYFLNYHIDFQDLTGDGINEFILRWGGTYIYSCINKNFKLLMYLEPDGYLRSPEIISIFDGNKNGIPEFLVLMGTASQGGSGYMVFEWQEDQFIELLRPYDSVTKQGKPIGTDPYGSVSISDVNSDGLLELHVDRGKPAWQGLLYDIPWRKEWDTYQWDGRYYTLSREEFCPPEYRFQAVYDGDRYTLYNEYGRAKEFYYQTINSDDLEWFSPEKAEKLHNEIMLEAGIAYNSPTDMIVVPDPNEYPNLVAYAYFRIMLINILQGSKIDAQVSYNTISTKYPEGVVGNIYTRLAQAFWEKYQTSGDIAQSCSKVVELVNANKTEVFKYLGIDGYMGMSLPIYTPQDICPFD